MGWVPGVGHVGGYPEVYPGVWAAQQMAGSIAAANAVANANAMAAATMTAQAAAAGAASGRAQFVQALQTHLASIAPAVAANPDAAAHLAAAQNIATQLAS